MKPLANRKMEGNAALKQCIQSSLAPPAVATTQKKEAPRRRVGRKRKSWTGDEDILEEPSVLAAGKDIAELCMCSHNL